MLIAFIICIFLAVFLAISAHRSGSMASDGDYRFALPLVFAIVFSVAALILALVKFL